jgi:hypothetical protein
MCMAWAGAAARRSITVRVYRGIKTSKPELTRMHRIFRIPPNHLKDAEVPI